MPTPLAPVDTSFLALDTPTTSQVIAAFGLLETAPDPAKVELAVGRLVKRFPRLRCVLSRRPSPRWIEEANFSITDRLSIKTIADLHTADQNRVFAETIAKRFSTAMRLLNKTWDLTVFTGPAGDPSQPAAFLFRFHHALADGLSGLEMIQEFTEPIGITRREASASSNAIPESQQFSENAGSLVRAFCRGFPTLVGELFSPFARGMLNGENSPGRDIVTFDLDLNLLRRAKYSYRVSYNELILALLAGALRRCYAESGSIPSSLRILIPISLRALDSRTSLGNHLTGVVIRIPLAEENREKRLAQIHRESSQLRTNGSPEAYDLIARASAKLPFSLQRQGAKFFAKKTSCICTNLPFVTRPRSFGGSRVTALYGLPALMAGHQLAFSFLSYAGRTHVSIVLDSKSPIDRTRLVNAFSAECDELVTKAVSTS